MGWMTMMTEIGDIPIPPLPGMPNWPGSHAIRPAWIKRSRQKSMSNGFAAYPGLKWRRGFCTPRKKTEGDGIACLNRKIRFSRPVARRLSLIPLGGARRIKIWPRQGVGPPRHMTNRGACTHKPFCSGRGAEGFPPDPFGGRNLPLPLQKEAPGVGNPLQIENPTLFWGRTTR